MANIREAEQAIAEASRRIWDGKITLYKHAGKSDNWFARFYADRKQFNRTTGTAVDADAERIAITWYIQSIDALKNGEKPATTQRRVETKKPVKVAKPGTFREAAVKALEDYKTDGHAESYIKGLTKLFSKLSEFIGNEQIGSVDQATWTHIKKQLKSMNPDIRQKTIHQYKNALMVVLNRAWIRKDIPDQVVFAREFASSKTVTHRGWFTKEEYRKLKDALRANIARHKKEKTHHTVDAEELHDFVIFVTNTGMRIGEANNLLVRDVSIVTEKDDKGNLRDVLHIENIKGKVGTRNCKSFYGAPFVFRRILERHGLTEQNYKQSDAKLFHRYHREMFKKLLRDAGLYETKDNPPVRRDLMCCRHTYICFAIQGEVPIADVAKATGTSIQMINDHYFKRMDALLSKNINRRRSDEFGD